MLRGAAKLFPFFLRPAFTVAPPVYHANAVNSAQNAIYTLDGSSASTKGVMTGWIRPVAPHVTGTEYLFGGNGDGWLMGVFDLGGGLFSAIYYLFDFLGLAGARTYNFAFTGAYNGAWNFFGLSWDFTAGARTISMAFNGAATNTPTIDLDVPGAQTFNLAVGLAGSPGAKFMDRWTDVAAQRWDGDEAEFYINLGQTIDFTVAANLQKWRTPAGKPIDLLAAPPLPTAPAVYLRGNAAGWTVNSGVDGNLTAALSVVTNAATSPSD